MNTVNANYLASIMHDLNDVFPLPEGFNGHHNIILCEHDYLVVSVWVTDKESPAGVRSYSFTCNDLGDELSKSTFSKWKDDLDKFMKPPGRDH